MTTASPHAARLGSLFSPLAAGALRTATRVWMAPLTRSRSLQPGDIPGPLNAEYYRQRAHPTDAAALIISEATNISPRARGYFAAPGIWTDAHIAGWKLVTDAVHHAGGLIVCQLWHTGRMSHAALQPNGQPPVSASAIAAPRSTYIDATFTRVPCSTPRALNTAELPAVVNEYRHAAHAAKLAGFDGVEIHGANGYLLEQFLRTGTNTRTDAYGGSIANRARLCLEVTDTVCDVWGPDRVGYRISPIFADPAADRGEPDVMGTYGYLCDQLGRRRLAFLHAVEQFRQDQREPNLDAVIARCRDGFKLAGGHAYIANGAYAPDTASHAIASGHCDAVAFGRPFISNPHLAARFRAGAALTPWDEATFYGGDARGYTDYPVTANA